mmetsp:Transcript_3811/g.10982  ORF Transcript_3811/g.10982 Transcript_3811/m.10982 type:complete len:493 (-) Transcript_3811:2150-3628(-)
MGDGLEVGRGHVTQIANSSLHSIDDRGNQQSLFLSQACVGLVVVRQILPRLQAVAQLRVVSRAEAEVLQEGLNKLPCADPPTRVCPQRSSSRLSGGSDLGLEGRVKIQAIPGPPPIILRVVECTDPVQDGPGIDSTLDEVPRGVRIAGISPRLAQHVSHLGLELVVVVDDLLALGCRSLQVCAAVHALQSSEVIPEVVDESIPLIRKVLRLASNWPVKALEPLPRQPCLAQYAPVHIPVPAALKKADVSLADGNVVRGRVVVELLVPLLHPRALHLLHLVPVHNVQDVVPDLLPIRPSLADATHAHASPLLRRAKVRSVLECPRELQGEVLLGPCQDSRLCIVVALPSELSHARIAEPNEQRAETSGSVVPKVPIHHPSDELAAGVKPVHEGPLVPVLPVDDFIDQGILQVVALAVLVLIWEWDDKVAMPPVLPPLRGVAGLDHERNAKNVVQGLRNPNAHLLQRNPWRRSVLTKSGVHTDAIFAFRGFRRP